MIPVYQTRFGDDGNCIQACIASIMGWNTIVGALPHVEAGDDANGWVILAGYLEEHYRLTFRHLLPYEFVGVRPVGHHIIGGMGPRGLSHAVVGYEGVMVFDPHPEGGGLTTVEDWSLLVPYLPETQEDE